MRQNILTINAGSTSLKCGLLKMPAGKILWSASVDKVKNHARALKAVWKKLPPEKIAVVAHRVIHGGEKFSQPIRLTPTVIRRLKSYSHLAPLHNPANLAAIETARELLPSVPQIAVFDTAFFANLPEVARLYALPRKITRKYHYHRYGFHGLSHAAAAQAAAKALKRPLSKLKLITCHLGGGCSLAAIKDGLPIDTSMGWTPLEGVPMMTRCGDLDPGIVLDLAARLGPVKAGHILNCSSGLLGLSGHDDFLKLLRRVRRGQIAASLTFDVFVYKIKKYLGAYYAILNGCDALVFTGAIGAGDSFTRRAICDQMSILKNTRVLVVPANEELQIARETYRLIFN